MVTLLEPRMAKTKPDGHCEYVGTKIDDHVLPLARAAAALTGLDTQDFISNAVNEAASKVLGRAPIKRRAPKPKEKRRPSA